MNTHTIIDVVPPTGGVEYHRLFEAPSVPQDEPTGKTVPEDAIWQRRTGNEFLLLQKPGANEHSAYLLEVEEKDDTHASGRVWAKDRYSWQLVGPSIFNMNNWGIEAVDVVFDPDLNPDSVRVLRP